MILSLKDFFPLSCQVYTGSTAKQKKLHQISRKTGCVVKQMDANAIVTSQCTQREESGSPELRPRDRSGCYGNAGQAATGTRAAEPRGHGGPNPPVLTQGLWVCPFHERRTFHRNVQTRGLCAHGHTGARVQTPRPHALTGARAHGHTGTRAHGHTGTRAHGHTGTRAHGLTGSRAHSAHS